MLRSFAVKIGTSAIPDWARAAEIVDVFTPTTNSGAVSVGENVFGPGVTGALLSDARVDSITGTTGDWITVVVRVS